MIRIKTLTKEWLPEFTSTVMQSCRPYERFTVNKNTVYSTNCAIYLFLKFINSLCEEVNFFGLENINFQTFFARIKGSF